MRIKNPDAVKRKLTRMTALGKDNLQVRAFVYVHVASQVISDFDWTMSKFLYKGEPNPTCHGIFEQAPDMTLEIQNQLHILQKTYEPIEWDPTIPVSTKIPIMVEWWDSAQKAIVTSNMHKDTLRATVNQCHLALRDYVGDFMVQLHRENIPLLIFSAGIGNVIELLLERFLLRFDNIQGLLIGFQEPIIHTYNKTIASFYTSDYINNVLSKRSSIILLGDSSADPSMVDGIPREGVDSDLSILKIGYLNNNVETLLDTYMDIYDIVLIDDATFRIPLEVLNCIVHSESLDF
ncbi:unnamed protein product [Dibothriocephalus latus]|uniref:5'-nucleotidase n=1 Tax=Dibothriocephalus latus TaxID=60516 RepID=A0A3P7L8K0_DIBLA|nr:unnamed protein product [Dibothriocephalus latus]